MLINGTQYKINKGNTIEARSLYRVVQSVGGRIFGIQEFEQPKIKAQFKVIFYNGIDPLEQLQESADIYYTDQGERVFGSAVSYANPIKMYIKKIASGRLDLKTWYSEYEAYPDSILINGNSLSWDDICFEDKHNGIASLYSDIKSQYNGYSIAFKPDTYSYKHTISIDCNREQSMMLQYQFLSPASDFKIEMPIEWLNLKPFTMLNDGVYMYLESLSEYMYALNRSKLDITIGLA